MRSLPLAVELREKGISRFERLGRTGSRGTNMKARVENVKAEGPRPTMATMEAAAVPVRDFFLSFEGVFDARAAQRIRETVARIGPGCALHVDLTHASLPDFALAILAQAVAPSQQAIRIVLQGLGRHQLRILRYFGVDLPVDDLPAPSQA
jgi:hypothetical protein